MAEGKRLDPLMVIIIAVVALFLNVGGSYDKLSGWLSEESAKISGDGNAPLQCLHDRVTMTVGPMQNALDSSNSVTSEYVRVIVNGADRGLYTDSSTLTTTYNDEVEIYYAENSSSYFSNKESFNVPCASAFSSAGMGEGYRIFKSNNEDSSNVTSNWYCWTSSSNTKIVSGNKQAVSANNPITLTCEIRPIPDEVFSPEGKPAVCFTYSGANFTSGTPSILDSSRVNSPDWLNPDAYYDSKRCFEIDNLLQETVTYKILIESSEDAPGEIEQWLVDQDWFRLKQGGMALDYKDYLGNDVGSVYEARNIIYLS